MVAYEDYPRDFEEFIEKFNSEAACINYIIQLRWPDGYTCPRCNDKKAWKTGRNLLHCANCSHQASVIAGTLFQGTRKSLRLWLHVMWWVVSQKTGASAKNLQETMGFKSYQTAWVWLQKLRRAMVRPHRDRLQGNVEVDEAYFGGKETGVRGRQTITKTLVVVAAEVKGNKIGRVRFRSIPDASSESLVSFIQDTITLGSTIVTDGWKGYSSITNCGYIHEVTIATANETDESKMLPHIHLVISLVKRWLMGTHQGAISSSYLDYYLDEYAFRFNRKLSTHRGKLFYRLMQQAVVTPPIPLGAITKNKNKI